MSVAPELKALGRYRIDRVLGKGAMGVVYEGFDPRLNRRVAIKTILKAHLDEETAKDYSQRFVREAQAVARLNHPNIVQVHDFGEEGEVAYLVLEFIQGRELKAYFEASERFDMPSAVRIMSELCHALEFAHNAGVVHRDVKPANVMIDAQGRAKLTDFGVARVQDLARGGQATSTMVGTPAFMSPEQITGSKIDRRTDVFSAGIILYQILTGNLPFEGDGAWTIARKIMQDEPPRPSAIDTTITPLFDAVVRKALAKNPDQRYQSARELGTALRRALDGKPEETAPAGEQTLIAPHDDASASPAPLTTRPPGPRASTGDALGTQGREQLEVEYWRSIKDGNDPADFELYLRQFPLGTYADLAKRKIAKLRGLATNTQPPGSTDAGGEATILQSKPAAPGGKKRALGAGIFIGLAVIGIGIYLALPSSKPPPVETKAPAVDDAAKAAAAAAVKAAADKEVAAAEKAAAKRTAADKAAAEKAAAARATEDKARQDAQAKQFEAERRKQQAAMEEEQRQMRAKMDDERKQNQAKLDEERRRLQQDQQQKSRDTDTKATTEKKPATKRGPAFVAPTF
jgi:serine/threonine-protein kinase